MKSTRPSWPTITRILFLAILMPAFLAVVPVVAQAELHPSLNHLRDFLGPEDGVIRGDVLSGETGELLPQDLYSRMRRAKNFQSAMQMVRQLEFAIFDFRIHREHDPKRGGRIYEILEEVRDQVAVIKPPAFNRFAHGFSHIFSGGYAAGYYSYKWAEVLSADAFSLFEERGVFDAGTGSDFRTCILEKGGSAEAMDLYVDFRGREPTIDALLRHTGIAA